jgi:hypothetical protein
MSEPIRLQRSYTWTTQRPMTIAQAVGETCDPTVSSGNLEDAQDRIRNSIDMLGKLVERLHGKGLLDTDEVIQVLGGWWEVAP